MKFVNLCLLDDEHIECVNSSRSGNVILCEDPYKKEGCGLTSRTIKCSYSSKKKVGEDE